jgi:hypothetical protein
MRVVLDYAGSFPEPVQEQILGGTCARFYSLASRGEAT